MKKLRIAYFNQLGRRQLDRIVDQFKQKNSDVEIELIGMGHDEAFDKLAKNEVDLAISDLRDDQL
ncbi:LysR substrate-binding domain-containing protein, partial [Lactobacillus helveticus]